MKQLIFISILITSLYTIGQEKLKPIDSVLSAIETVKVYDEKKVQRINTLRTRLQQTSSSNITKRYQLNVSLFQEYKVFKQDSAFSYGLKIKKLAEKIDSVILVAEATIKLAEVNIAAGMYKEGLDFLSSIAIQNLPDAIKSDYFEVMGRCYNEMADYSNLSYYSKKYNELAIEYRKQALTLIPDDTFRKKFMTGIVQYDQGELIKSLTTLKNLSQKSLNFREAALVNSVMGYIYENQNQTDQAIYHFALASIADIKSSTKETLASTALAKLLYQKGDTKKASVFIRKANNDAEFFGAQQRKIEVGAILPIIEEQLVDQIEKQKEILYKRNLIMTILIIFLIGLALIILLQINRIKKAKTIISNTNESLKNTNEKILSINSQVALKNNQLKELNYDLLEANKIKEEYLGLFFTHDAQIFEKFKEFKAKIDRDLADENIHKLKYTVKALNLKREKERLLKNFDEAFIQLFPNFVEEFNSLLKPEEKVILKPGQLLNKELRIFALMRLGIKRHEIIAQILDFNVNSVYTYKTRIRRKSTLNSKEFDKKLLQNTTLKL